MDMEEDDAEITFHPQLRVDRNRNGGHATVSVEHSNTGSLQRNIADMSDGELRRRIETVRSRIAELSTDRSITGVRRALASELSSESEGDNDRRRVRHSDTRTARTADYSSVRRQNDGESRRPDSRTTVDSFGEFDGGCATIGRRHSAKTAAKDATTSQQPTPIDGRSAASGRQHRAADDKVGSVRLPADDATTSRRVTPTIKLGTYDGSTALE